MEFIHPRDFEPVPPDVLTLFPQGLVKKNMVIPLAKKEGRLTAAVPKTDGVVKPSGLQMVAGCPVDLVLAPLDEIMDFIKTHYAAELGEVGVPQETNVSSPVEKLLSEAVKNRASHVFIELRDHQVRVRHRIRGVTVTPQPGVTWNEAQASSLFAVVREKGESKNNDGVAWFEWRDDVSFAGEKYDCLFVLSDTPHFNLLTAHIKPYKESLFSPGDWGLDAAQEKTFEYFLTRRNGLVLFIGSQEDVGVTLRASLRKLAGEGRSCLSLEPRISEWIKDVHQLEFHGNDIKGALAHDPDVLMVDPVEKREIIEECLEGALHGALIFGRMPALDAAEALVKLVRLGIEPTLLSSAVLGVVTEKHIRLNCSHCSKAVYYSSEQLRDLEVLWDFEPITFYRGEGCEHCFKTGFDRETSVFEVVSLTEELQSLLNRDVRPEAIRSAMKLNGVMTLKQAAFRKAMNGQTSLTEILRILPK